MPDRDYEVGYGKPPKANQFKKGVSGNPKGAKPKPKDFAGLLDLELSRPIKIREGGRALRLSKRAAAVKQLVNKAVNGDPRAVDVILKHDRENGTPSSFELTAEDEATLTEALERHSKKQKWVTPPENGWK